jgi:GNAT superfamily N-acetyltransferase
MSRIEYVAMTKVDPDQLLSLLNKDTVRKHLMNHQSFDKESLSLWSQEKIEVDSARGCRVRAIVVDNQCVGWCGIQQEGGEYEIALVLDDRYWGLGRKIFRELMSWATELGHQTVYVHFLHTRPEYKFLRKIANSVYENEIMGNKFTTYRLSVN